MGVDFMIDSDFCPYLIEINVNPALSIDTSTQRKVIPNVVSKSLKLILEFNANLAESIFSIRHGNFDFRGFEILLNEIKVVR